MAHGLVTNIERFCIDDGPGIRSSIFLMGCPLRCKWCSNPETWHLKKKIFVVKELCNGCGECLDVCGQNAIVAENEKISINSDKCNECGRCIDACVYGAIKIYGKYYEVDEAVEELLRDRIFYEMSGGGVTITGGEPTLQMDFLADLCAKLKKNYINIALDTCGSFSFKRFSHILGYLDLVLFDIKLMDENLHQFYTGVSNEKILENLFQLDKHSIPINIRFIMVKNVNDSQKEMKKKIELISRLKNIKRVDILPYHRLGIKKYEWLGLEPPEFEAPDDNDIEFFKNKISEAGIDCHILGN